MLRVAVTDEDDEPILAAYCPYCAEREFGLARRTDSARTDPEQFEVPRSPARNG